MKKSILVCVILLLSASGHGECPSADLTGDCRVGLADLAVMASQWMTEGVPDDPENLVWVYIDDSGAGMKDEFGNPISHGGFTGEMSKYETTNAQYCEFLNAGLASEDITVGVDGVVFGANGSNSGDDFVGEIYFDTYAADSESQITYSDDIFHVRSRKDIDDNDIDMSEHPVTMASWYGATAFCNYYGYRLPTEWEWQAVADYDGDYIYGYGTTLDPSKANSRISDQVYANPLGLSSKPYTSPVNHYPSYGYGMNDMAGNVYEWTDSWFSAGSAYFICGGSWESHASSCTVSWRYDSAPFNTLRFTGFRVCR